ncbi:hypothetical protein B0H13DRAFT_2310600 [Mycena leptocephala]|nr:hypothetical protein B0H13DRAFT_2310600 [Mycena leptocephala]
MHFSTGSWSREALYESTAMGNNLHVGSVRFDGRFEVEEGGVEPIEFFEDSVRFLRDSDTIIDSEIQIHIETDTPHPEAKTDLKEVESMIPHRQAMQIELAAEGATKSYEILELELEAERYPELLKIETPLMPAFDADMRKYCDQTSSEEDGEKPLDASTAFMARHLEQSRFMSV